MSRALALCAVFFLAGCLEDLPTPDGGRDSGTSDDSGIADAGTPDAGIPDSGTDAGTQDAGTDAGIDAGPCSALTRTDGGSTWPIADAGVLFARSADLDRDGFDDLIIAVKSPVRGLHIFRGSATGFGLASTGFLSTEPYESPAFTVADFNGDGCPDIVSVGLKSIADGGLDEEREAFDGFEGTGDLTFPLARKRWERHEPGSVRGTIADLTSGLFDLDNTRDLVRARNGPGNMFGGGAQFFTLNWATFAPFTEQTIPGPGFDFGNDQEWLGPPVTVATFSVDGGRDRLAAGAQNGMILYQPWNGTFSVGGALTSGVGNRPNIPYAIADIDGDDEPEFVVAEASATFFLRPPSVRFAEDQSTRWTGINERALAVAQFDDGGVEYVLLRDLPANIRIVQNVSFQSDAGIEGPFTAINLTQSVEPVAMALGRFTGADLRIMAIDRAGTLHCVYLNSSNQLRICP